MPEMSKNEASLRRVMTVDFETTRTISGGHPEGDRVLLNVAGGTFHGDGPHGAFQGSVAHGSDWVTKYPDGSMALDVRAQLLASDGTAILMTYAGISADGVVHTTPTFSAPGSSAFGWLNRLVCLARGEVREGGVSYDVYTLQ
ncbi:DUF3237 domain-containing protein [Streptomyces sp. NPDC097610]|uniref:DUF3237 domain-containing protein n=1 Tax=Streptomyces sp. NPDC097610 TaxID=3157227 RepID=UPI00331738F1